MMRRLLTVAAISVAMLTAACSSGGDSNRIGDLGADAEGFDGDAVTLETAPREFEARPYEDYAECRREDFQSFASEGAEVFGVQCSDDGWTLLKERTADGEEIFHILGWNGSEWLLVPEPDCARVTTLNEGDCQKVASGS